MRVIGFGLGFGFGVIRVSGFRAKGFSCVKRLGL